MSSRKNWNKRDKRNYSRSFGDQYDKPTRKSKKRKNKSLRVISRLVILAIIVSGIIMSMNYFLGNPMEKPENITFVDSEPSYSCCIADPISIPEYSGKDYIILNDGIPNFTRWDYENIRGESYSPLDRLGRCGTAIAMLDRSMMPTGKRGKIGNIKPTGWVQNKYEGIIDSYPPYLYNRSHLIAHALTGQNDNARNLITGTRYMNATIMLPWEEKVMRYLDGSNNHVLYRVTPFFVGVELLSRGVEMEAYSVEDQGEGVCYHVFVYNIQPGIELNYSTGGNRIAR